MKQCSKCKTPKELDQFCTDNRTPDKKKRWCKDCCAKSGENWKLKNPGKYVESYKKWQKNNKDKTKQRDAERYKKDRDKILAYNKKWMDENKEQRKQYNAKWISENIDKRDAYRKKHLSSFKNHIHATVSRAILKSLRGGNKGGATWPDLVGYNVNELIVHLKKTMPEGYTWSDYGREKLHIDHKTPVAAFNFSSPQDIDFKRCWALKNLRLLPAFDNMSKSDSLDRPFQPSLAMEA